MMTFDDLTLRAAVLLFAVGSVSAAAQPVAPKPAAAPSAWTVTANEAAGTVRAAATAKDGTVRFVIGCSAASPSGLSGLISGYRGAGLRSDGEIDTVAFYAEGADWRDAYAIRLRYSAARQGWELARPLSPIFLSSFSRGATLSVVDGRNQEIFAFDLTGSTAATSALRRGCGLPSLAN